MINLTMRDDTGGSVQLIQPMLGMNPYLLVTAEPDDSADGVSLNIQTGGGIPQDLGELSSWLRELADTVDDAAAQHGEAPRG